GDEKSDHRSGEAHIEQGAARGDWRADADERAERAEQSWGGDEVGITDVDVVEPASKIMTEFMREQDAEQRKRKRDAQQQQARMRERVEHHPERILITREGRLIHRVRTGEFRADRESGNHGEDKKNQRGPERAAARGRRRRRLRERREMHLHDLDGDPAVTIAAVVVDAPGSWMQRREKMVRRY